MSVERTKQIAMALASEVLKGPDGRLCSACAEIVSVAGAGISIMTVDHSIRMCVSNQRMDTLEDLQFTLGEGPCQDAYSSGAPLLVPDLDRMAIARWPAFITEAARVGVRAVFAYPMSYQRSTLGVLTLYQDQPGSLSETQRADCVALSDVLAKTVLTLIASSPPDALSPPLDDAIAHRAEVHQAAGMASVQLGISVGEALVVMRAHAYAHGQILHVVAADIVQRRLRLDSQGNDR